MAYATVPVMPYFGYSLARMQAELAKYHAAMDAMTPGPNNIVSASANGSSFTYGPNGVWSLDQWGVEIQAALSWLDDSVINPSNAAVATFTGG